MTQKKIIAVVAGGFSSEYIVSVKSAKFVMQCIDPEKFIPYLIRIRENEWVMMENDKVVAQVDRADFSVMLNGEKINFDFVYNIIHGTPGEDGFLQGYFDLLNIPYSSSDLQSSALTFNKYYCNNFLRGLDIPVSKSQRLFKGDVIDASEVVNRLSLPLFVKPNVGGSSFGVTKVKAIEELQPAIDHAFDEAPEVMIEAFLDGNEFTCGVYSLNGKIHALPITEVIPENEFFNYESKYVEGKAQEITPARLTAEQTTTVQEMTKRVYQLLGCKGICRIDYILVGEQFYFLEANTIPGMTATSFIPQQVQAAGINISDLLTQLIEEGIEKNQFHLTV